MKLFDLKVWDLDKELFTGKVSSVKVSAIDGGVQILAGHIPYINALKPNSQIEFVDESGKIIKLNAAKGFLNVREDTAYVFI